jgi:hypothetical protein
MKEEINMLGSQRLFLEILLWSPNWYHYLQTCSLSTHSLAASEFLLQWSDSVTALFKTFNDVTPFKA